VRELQRELRGLETRAAAAERRATQLRAQLEDAEAKVSELDGQRRRAEEAIAAAERELEQPMA
jgi:septal ring factor EnvC (AmiA/AmiB activator)